MMPVAEKIDTERYEIEKISGNKIINNTILYKIQWVGYTKDYDSEEAEWRMTCDEKLIEFSLSTLDKNRYIDRLEPMLLNYRKFRDDAKSIMNFIDPVSILALTTFQCGSVKFVDQDTVSSRFLLLEYLRDSKQQYLLHTAFLPSEDVIDESEHRYARELQSRMEVFSEHPLVKIIIPLDIEGVFYSPPPLSNLIFEPVTVWMCENSSHYENLFVSKSEDVGFNGTKPFLDSEYLEPKGPKQDPKYFHAFEANENKKFYNGMKRLDYQQDPRFHCNLKLISEIGRGWVLRASHVIPKETPIMMMAGVIGPWKRAHNSLVRSGERIAFSSFIEIPGTEMCLDRRLYHDFTKYIPHSCAPTCSVRLVKSGNEYPDLVVYSLTDINASNNFSISIDYYQGFRKYVNRYFWTNRHPDGKIFNLYENEIDFVHCQCMERQCRTILYIDKSLKSHDPSVGKEKKLENLDPNFEFRGMSVVADTKRIWEIQKGVFVE
ncbi:hypothetical protein L3Y34_002004 [Caenorhabditis briggsae]|uniref:Chromo domain-containing protein n=3 Tax=Caenorhabditis briggsae TaxID=6238 RepID=A0AAE9DED1_CAEBR|nr:hypothetical protein L3Y34_002004 [Caenorhabditis briggsae]